MFAINRRSFLRAAGAASAATLMPGVHLLAAPEWELEQAESAKPIAANDHIQIALIGAGGQGSATPLGGAGAGRETGRGGRLLRRPARSAARNSGATTSSPRATITRSWRARTSTPSSSARPITGTSRLPSTP